MSSRSPRGAEGRVPHPGAWPRVDRAVRSRRSAPRAEATRCSGSPLKAEEDGQRSRGRYGAALAPARTRRLPQQSPRVNSFHHIGEQQWGNSAECRTRGGLRIANGRAGWRSARFARGGEGTASRARLAAHVRASGIAQAGGSGPGACPPTSRVPPGQSSASTERPVLRRSHSPAAAPRIRPAARTGPGAPGGFAPPGTSPPVASSKGSAATPDCPAPRAGPASRRDAAPCC